MTNAVWFIQAFWSGAGGLASLGCRTYMLLNNTQSNLETSIHSYVTGHFRIKGILRRPAVKGIS